MYTKAKEENDSMCASLYVDNNTGAVGLFSLSVFGVLFLQKVAGWQGRQQ